MRILNKITELATLMLIAVSAVSCNKITLFDEAFVAFDTAKSSVVSINATGEFTGSYTLHYTGPKPSAPIVVNFVVTCGNGLAEGVDYKVATAGGKITFMPVIYEQVIKIDWLPHEINESKDNTVTISLVSADGVTLGYPGPDKLMKDLLIRKYTTK